MIAKSRISTNFKFVSGKHNDIKSLLQYTETFNNENSNDKDGINLMTIHKSKGLEFQVVFVIGMVDGILPNRQGDIEEEKKGGLCGYESCDENSLPIVSQSSNGKESKN